MKKMINKRIFDGLLNFIFVWWIITHLVNCRRYDLWLYIFFFILLYLEFKKYRRKKLCYNWAYELGSYYDVWEIQIAWIHGQYLYYYKYIWKSWHELEIRVVWLLSMRIGFIGV